MLTSVIALVLAVPASLGIALFITELAPKRWRAVVTYVVDLLAAIPSVVYGFWALAVFTKPAGTLLHEHRRRRSGGSRCSAACSAVPRAGRAS